MLSGLTGTPSLAEELDSEHRPFLNATPQRRPLTPGAASARACAEKLIVMLRDGRKIIGVMRSFDQFANIVLEHAVERVVVGKRFADVPLGLYVIRGENVVLLGQIVRPPLSALPPAAPCPTLSHLWRHLAGRRQGGGDREHADGAGRGRGDPAGEKGGGRAAEAEDESDETAEHKRSL